MFSAEDFGNMQYWELMGTVLVCFFLLLSMIVNRTFLVLKSDIQINMFKQQVYVVY